MRVVQDIKKNIKKITIKNLIALLLLSVIIGSSCFTFVNKLVEAIVPKENVTITVNKRENNSTGGNEVWIAQQPQESKWALFEACKSGTKTGIWEYRDAEKFGYGFNMLVSYGENEGSSISFQCPDLPNKELLVWKNSISSSIAITAVGKTKNIDLYSDVDGGEVVSIFPFKDSKLALILKAAFYLLIYFIIFILFISIYILFFNGIKLSKVFLKEYKYRYVLIIYIAIYLFNILQYNIGIPNFLKFGDQLYYWNLTDPLVNGTATFSKTALKMVSFRGYICNIIPAMCKTVGVFLKINPIYIYLLFTATAGSLLFGYFIPKLHELLTGNKSHIYHIILMVTIFTVFWNGMLTAVLMDFMGVSCFIGGLMFLIWYAKEARISRAVFSGILLGTASLFRSSYKYAIIGAAVLATYVIVKKIYVQHKCLDNNKKSWINYISFKKLAIGFLSFLVSFIIVCIPQIQVNYQRGHIGLLSYDEKGSWSEPEFSLAEISANQCFTISITGYPYQVGDKQISSMKQQYYSTNEFLTMNQLLELFISNPTDSMIYIGKKLFSGFDVKTNMSYPHVNISNHSIYYIFSLLNYFVLACGLYSLFKLKINKKEKIVFALIFITLILPQTFVHVEWRYFIVGYLSLYYFAVYKFGDVIRNKLLFQNIMSSNFLWYLCGYLFISQWISRTFYG